jgi:hypothetical protein
VSEGERGRERKRVKERGWGGVVGGGRDARFRLASGGAPIPPSRVKVCASPHTLILASSPSVPSVQCREGPLQIRGPMRGNGDSIGDGHDLVPPQQRGRSAPRRYQGHRGGLPKRAPGEKATKGGAETERDCRWEGGIGAMVVMQCECTCGRVLDLSGARRHSAAHTGEVPLESFGLTSTCAALPA